MQQFLIDHELPLRQYVYYGCLISFLFVEELLPKRRIGLAYKIRWTANFSFLLINLVLLRFAVPVAMVELAFFLQKQQIGLFNNYLVPEAMLFVIAVIILDGSKYAMHRLAHKLPFLWRLHRVHHSDVDFDVTTSIRHHPLESLISNFVDLAVISIFGLPPEAIIVWVIAASTVDLFNHANLRIPVGLDISLRWLLVTPDMHRIHHSSYQPETDSNFSSFLSFWDRFFGSYRATPKLSHQEMEIGLDNWREQTQQSIFSLLLNPFYTIRK